MFLKSLTLSNFRIYEKGVFDFSEGINAIVGNNAVGKTTLLEAIYVALFGRSFRTLDLNELIREGEEAFQIEICFVKNQIEQQLNFFKSQKEKRIVYNRTALNTLSSLLGILHGVLLAPHDLDLIKGPPAMRRLFLDMQLAQVDPLYVHHLQRFQRAMKQRNFLLKTKQLASIEAFERIMAASAAYLTKQRQKNVVCLNQRSISFYNDIALQLEQLQLSYKTSAPMDEALSHIEDYFIKQYQKLRSKELEWGCTLVGPHKDDLWIAVNNREARYFASDGQKQSIMAALKFAEWSLIAESAGEPPMMMIDDFALSLDEGRQRTLCRQLEKMGQTYVSSPVKPLQFSKQISCIVISC